MQPNLESHTRPSASPREPNERQLREELHRAINARRLADSRAKMLRAAFFAFRGGDRLPCIPFGIAMSPATPSGTGGVAGVCSIVRPAAQLLICVKHKAAEHGYAGPAGLEAVATTAQARD